MTRPTPAGDFDYEAGGDGYATVRRPEPRIAALIQAALGDARTVLNVGAGAGSYEPTDRDVTPVEPSASMRAQRPAHLSPALDAAAEDLPFADGTFDAAMATYSIHQWRDLDRGLREVRRVTRGPVVIMTGEPDAVRRFWLRDYAPELIDTEARRYPALEHVGAVLGGEVRMTAVPIPFDCSDGFVEAFYGRPERLLDPAVRRAQSAWGFVAADDAERGVERLRAALADGRWDARYGDLRRQASFVGGLHLLVAD